MSRKIHDIYDVILKIISLSYGSAFLKYIGIEKEIKKVLNVEYTLLSGEKLYLDFICELVDDTLCHVEYQFPKAQPEDLDRFFNYNITVQVRTQKLAETCVFNFTSGKNRNHTIKIGESKSFHPKYFYLGDVDFKGHIENINKKVKSNKQLSNHEEITLMLICLNTELENKAKTLKNICKLLKHEDLFDESKFDYVKAVIKLEIENLLTNEEQKIIGDEIDMSPEAQSIITQAIHEVNQKSLAETRQKALAEGKKEGLKEGKEKGLKEGKKEMVKKFKKMIDLETLSEISGLTIEEIQKL